MCIKREIVDRNGEQYMQITDISVSIEILCDFKMDMKLNSLIPNIVQHVANEQANTNWVRLKPIIEKNGEEYVSQIVYNALNPIFARVPLRNFYLWSSGYVGPIRKQWNKYSERQILKEYAKNSQENDFNAQTIYPSLRRKGTHVSSRINKGKKYAYSIIFSRSYYKLAKYCFQ